MEYKNSMGRWLQIRKLKNLFVFPTLFSKLFTVYMGILLLTLLFLFVLFSNAFQSYFVEYTQNIMIKQARSIAQEYKNIGLYNPMNRNIDKILYRIEILDSYLDATTWLVDDTGEIIVMSGKDDISIEDKKVLDQKIVHKVQDGNIVRIENGFNDYFGAPMLTIGYPVDAFGNTSYALFIHTPMAELLSMIYAVRNAILKVVGITGSAIFLWIYFISKQITKPVKQMNIIAKKIANGQFDKRLEVTGKDEIAELALSFNHMAIELDKIEEKRQQFISNISHDLRSPLTSIQGFITAILDGTIPKENQEKYLNIVLQESKRMLTMANNILELSKVEEGEHILKKKTINMHALLNHVLDALEPQLVEKHVQVNRILQSNLSYVLADEDMIVRVVQNLLDNALKFVNEGGNVEIETKSKADKMWVYIRNSGEPIPKEVQKDIWTRFYKGDPSRGKHKQGAGLGLVIVKEIIKQHHQTVGVISKPGEMVTFYFSLDLSNTM